MTRLPRDDHHDFDARARACYRQAADTVPPQIRFKLRPRPATTRTTQRRPWILGTALAGAAGALALAIGIGQWQPDADTGMPVAAADDGIGNAADTATLLGSSPDFFAWLGSDEVRILAME